MQDNIEKILGKMKQLESELMDEIEALQDEFSYRVLEKKIHFAADALKQHKQHVLKLRHYPSRASPKNIATAPVIWSCIIPALLMDAFASAYQAICFPVYGIPKVRRRDHIMFDRIYLRYLNIIEKVNCLFCAYFNGLIAYVRQVAARTEQYWCPIKHARSEHGMHGRYKYFVKYGDAIGYRRDFAKIRKAFDDLK